MSTAAFDTLLVAYRTRDTGWRAARATGQPVVGYVGNTVPVEAITAAGALAWRVAPVQGDTGVADAHVEAFSDLDMRLVFAQFITGALDGLDVLIVPRSTETQHKLYLALREARRTGVTAGGPPLLLYDILHTQRETSRAYGLARTHDLVGQLGRLTGCTPSDADLTQAMAQTNATRGLLAELQQRRRSGAVSGWQAQVATGALCFMPPAAGQRALREWLAEGTPRPAAGPRLLVKGAPLDHDALHALVEELGAVIVAEDDDWGSRAAAPLVDRSRPPLESLFEHCWRERPCPRIHPSPLEGSWFAQTVAAGGFDGVLFNLPRPEDTHGWTQPAERALVRAAGLPSLLLRDDARDTTARPALRASLTTFIASLRG